MSPLVICILYMRCRYQYLIETNLKRILLTQNELLLQLWLEWFEHTIRSFRSKVIIRKWWITTVFDIISNLQQNVTYLKIFRKLWTCRKFWIKKHDYKVFSFYLFVCLLDSTRKCLSLDSSDENKISTLRNFGSNLVECNSSLPFYRYLDF